MLYIRAMVQFIYNVHDCGFLPSFYVDFCASDECCASHPIATSDIASWTEHLNALMQLMVQALI